MSVVAQHPDHVVEFIEGLPGRQPDFMQCVFGERRVAVEDPVCGPRLHYHRRHRMSDRIVKLSGQLSLRSEFGCVSLQHGHFIACRWAEQRNRNEPL